MTIKKKQNKAGVTRSQLALIGVLVAVLAIVIVVQLPDSQHGPSPVAASEPNGTSSSDLDVSIQTQEGRLKEEADKRAEREWPQFSTEQIVRLDPLSTPDWYKNILEVEVQRENSNIVAETEHDLQLDEMQDEGTGIVLITGSERIAKVGDTHVRVGDKIDGYEVSNITSQGVILTKSKSR